MELNQPLRVRKYFKTQTPFGMPDVEVWSGDHVVASMKPVGAGFDARTADGIWEFGWRSFRPFEGDVFPPPRSGIFEAHRSVTFPEGWLYRWKLVSFWKSRMGFFDDEDRLVLEASAFSKLWIRGEAGDPAHLPVLIFVAILFGITPKR